MTKNNKKYPLFLSKVSCGFPSPAEDYIEKNISLDDLLILHPAATFFLRAQGDSMTGAGIFSGDILIVDKSIEPTNNHIVVAVLNGDLLVKRLKIEGNKAYLCAENKSYSSIPFDEDLNSQIWGVVTNVIHSLMKNNRR